MFDVEFESAYFMAQETPMLESEDAYYSDSFVGNVNWVD